MSAPPLTVATVNPFSQSLQLVSNLVPVLDNTAPDFLHETFGTKLRRKAALANLKNPFFKSPVCMVTIPWQPSLVIGMEGVRVVNGGNVYFYTVGGTTSATGTGPSGIFSGGVT